jgi:hypothetical protein
VRGASDEVCTLFANCMDLYNCNWLHGGIRAKLQLSKEMLEAPIPEWENHKVRLTMSESKTIFGNISKHVDINGGSHREYFYRHIKEMTGYSYLCSPPMNQGSFLRLNDDNQVLIINIDNLYNNKKYVPEVTKIIFAASKILNVDLESFFVGVDMTHDKAELLIACIALKGAETCGKKEEVSKGYVQILENIKSAIRSSGGLTRLVATDRDIIAEWEEGGKIDRIHINFAKIEGLKDVLTPHVLVKLSNTLGLDVRDFFFSDMDREMLDLRYECFKLLWKDGAERAEKETEKELKAKAAEFQKCCLGEGEMLGPDCNLRSEWVQDTSFLKYVDCMTALKNAMTHKPPCVIKGLIKIKEFKDVLTSNDNEIITYAISKLIENPSNIFWLEKFCIIATIEKVRSAIYVHFGHNYTTKLSKEVGHLLEFRNIRDMLLIIKYFSSFHSNTDKDENCNYFDKILAQAILKETLE